MKFQQLLSSVAHPQLSDGQQLPAQISKNAEAPGIYHLFAKFGII